MLRRSAIAGLSCWLGCFAPTASFAQDAEAAPPLLEEAPPPEVETEPAEDPIALQQDGMLRFLDSDYEAALDLWERAYEVSGDPDALPDIALALERLGRDPEALAVNRRALEALPDQRELLLGRIAALEARLSADEDRVEEVRRVERERVAAAVPPDATPMWLMVGVTAATAVSAAILGGLALDAQGALDRQLLEAPVDPIVVAALRSDVRAFAVATDVLWPAALIAGGVTLGLVLVQVLFRPPPGQAVRPHGLGVEARF